MNQGHFTRSRYASLMTWEQYQHLNDQILDSQSSPYPIEAGRYFGESKGANLLTKMILWHLRHCGFYAYRNNTTGIPRRLRDGSVRFTPGSRYARGAGDIFATIEGRACFIEVKFGKDRMSQDQEKFRKGFEASGGAFTVVRTWSDYLGFLDYVSPPLNTDFQARSDSLSSPDGKEAEKS